MNYELHFKVPVYEYRPAEMPRQTGEFWTHDLPSTTTWTWTWIQKPILILRVFGVRRLPKWKFAPASSKPPAGIACAQQLPSLFSA
ncbi:hypothetical protein ACLKA7_015749 [Drosophila subpalustris]